MIADRGVTRIQIYPCARGFFIIFTMVVALHGVILASAKNTTSNCGGDFSGYQYTISSPGYPGSYPEKQDCVYTLRGSQLAKCDQVYHLQFLDFGLKNSENCDVDYLKIGDQSFYCGNVTGIRSYPGRNNSLTLGFRSSAGSSGKGFKILVTTSPCLGRQSNKHNDENIAEQRTTEGSVGAATEKPVDVKIVSRNDIERIGIVETKNSYPVYRPETDFPLEDYGRSGRQDPLPVKIEALDKSEKNTVQRVRQGVSKYLPNNLELPVHRSKPFRDSPRLEIVTATSIKSDQPPKISSYLFLPPATLEESTGNGASPRSSSTNVTKGPKSDAENFVTPPPTEYLLPNRWAVNFRKTPLTNLTTQLPFVRNRQRINQKFVVPARAYGVPEEPYYPPVKVFETAIKIGEVLENPGETADCLGNANLEPDLEVPASFGDNAPALIDTVATGSPSVFVGNYYPAMTYGVPGSNYPRNVPNTGLDRTPFNYGPPVNYPPGNGAANGSGRPDGWIPSVRYPSSSVGGRYPNIIPSVGLGRGSIYPGTVNPGTGGRYAECCSNVYSAQRSLLASPGFPSILYSGNAYECIYTIRPYSQTTCQIRFNFKFFNHGNEDSSCSNGHVEIDGRRICGCKKNLSIVSTVSSPFPKIIGVSYTGYPKTKFNGFLIEIVQEPCSNSYPFGSRRKKDVGTTQEDAASDWDRSSDAANSTSRRTKRNLGYSYSKPNFGLIEVPGGSQSWNSGNVVQTGIHQLSGDAGTSANFFSPLLTCQALSFFDWTVAAKEAYLRGARCVRNGGRLPANPGVTFPSYPGNGGPGITFPSYPVNPGAVFPSYPGNGGSGVTFPPYPGNSGAAFPAYPGNAGTGITFPSYPGNPGAALPSYPGNPGAALPSYPGNPAATLPSYPGNVGAGTAFPWPNSPGSNSGYQNIGSWNFPFAKCQDVNVVEGIISSPHYPTNYPPNVNKCYRFYKSPNSCQLELAFLDFDLENSAGCTKDYLAFSGQNERYCGRSLAGSKAFLDISRSNVVDIYFVSDGFGSGRGFSAGFSQIPCRGSIINHSRD